MTSADVPTDSVTAVTGAPPGGPRSRGVIYFCVGDKATNMCSYVWRLWWGRTSFYLSTRDREKFANLKISLHGPDERYAAPGFKIGHDGLDQERSTPNGLLVVPPEWLPCWFIGRAVTESATHVLRFRFPFNLFRRGYPSAPIPKDVKTRDFAGLIPPPARELDVIDVDVYVSTGRPYWPNERRARRDNACLGPLENDAGEQLSAVVVSRSTVQYPTPMRAQAPGPSGSEDRVRGIGATVDDSGLLWICEQWMSRSAFRAA
jgi:hypothetical protein